MELQKGMYIRYTRGMINGNIPPRIAKIVDCSDNELIKIDNGQVILNEDIIGIPSFDLIYLIKIGDYVNGYPVVDIMDSYDTETKRRINRTVYIDKPCAGVKIWWTPLLNGDIKEVITKEQFEACKYLIERDK